MESEQAEVRRGRGGRWSRGPRFLLLAVVPLLAAGVIAGCGGDDDDDDGGDGGGEEAAISSFAIATPEDANDLGWNQRAVEAANAVAEERDLEVEVADGSGYEDTAAVLRELATSGAGLVIAQASGYATVASDVAMQTGTPMVVWNLPPATTPELVVDAETSAQQGAYVAGALAAQRTESGVLGVVTAGDNFDFNKAIGGFITGARSVDPNVDIRFAQVGPVAYADVAAAKRVTDTVIAGGADIVFGLGDGASFGMIEAVAQAGDVQFIDFIGDKTTADGGDVILTSVLYNFEPIFTQAIDDLEAGTFGERGYEINVENGGIELLRTDKIDGGTWEELEMMTDQIASGEIDVPETEERSEVTELLNQ
jgi:basic membrane protein A and related proteins